MYPDQYEEDEEIPTLKRHIGCIGEGPIADLNHMQSRKVSVNYSR